MRVGLQHGNPLVPVLVVEQLHRCARDEELAVKVRNHLFLKDMILQHQAMQFQILKVILKFVMNIPGNLTRYILIKYVLVLQYMKFNTRYFYITYKKQNIALHILVLINQTICLRTPLRKTR